MRVFRLKTFALLLGCCATAGTVMHMMSPVVSAQSIISGDIVGTVTDASGAALPGAKVVVTSQATGQAKTVVTDSVGGYRIPLLAPGKYKITVTATGFDLTAQATTVAASSVATVNFNLSVGKAAETVEVSSDAIQTMDTDSAQTATSFDLQQIQSLPNPGGDLTFVAQTTPGAVMNTQSGYGNFSVNGLPGTSNVFTVNGGYEGDPYLNVGSSGASNLLLGNNDVDTVTVTTNAYDATFGGLGGAQISEISRSGSNQIHGNAVYWWNGRAMNANSWFNKQSGTERAFDNANQWAASVGGPIKKNKIFGFVDYEGLRVVIPSRETVYAPSAAYQAAILGTRAQDSGINSLIPNGNLAFNGQSSQATLYKAIFNYYNNAKNASNCVQDPNDPDTCTFNGQASNFAKEWLINDRVDVVLGPQDSFYVHSKVDHGTQPTVSSYISSDFNAQSPQPSYEGQLAETHTFSPNLTNQFLFTASYSRSVFTNTNAKAAFNNVPFVLAAYASQDSVTSGDTTRYYDWYNSDAAGWVGGEDYAFPQGRMVTGYQFSDDLTWLKGKHTFKVGYTFRRDDITDYTSSERVYANGGGLNYMMSQDNFAAGQTDEWAERFPQRLSQPVALYVEGAYLQDQWKPNDKLTVTVGLRLEHNSNPICVTNCVSNFANDFDKLSTASSTAYNTLMASGRHRAYFHQQDIGWQPRLGFAYLPFGASSKTTIRGGVGMFNDYFPAQIMGSLVSNIPSVNRFTVYGPFNGGSTAISTDSTLSTSGHATATTSNNALTSLYSKGACFSGCNSSLDLTVQTGGVFSAPTVTGTARNLHLPTYLEWNFGVEQQLYRNTALKLNYVGNRSYHQPVAVMPNSYNSTGKLASLATSKPNASFGSVTEYYSASVSNYNGLQVQLASRINWATVQFNYTWGHALDTSSNGGFDDFGSNSSGQINPYNLKQNYGNADYDVRQYISASYVLNIPHTKGPKLLVDNWEVAGTIFHNTGNPFSVVDSTTTVTNGNHPLAKQLDNNFNHHCGGDSHTLNACDFASHFTAATDYGQQRRNQLFGPNYTDFDVDVSKGFNVPGIEKGKVKVGVQFFNVFNHANFLAPVNSYGSSYLGMIQSTASTPTSILGSGLGGDASPRLIQLKGTFSF